MGLQLTIEFDSSIDDKAESLNASAKPTKHEWEKLNNFPSSVTLAL